MLIAGPSHLLGLCPCMPPMLDVARSELATGKAGKARCHAARLADPVRTHGGGPSPFERGLQANPTAAM